MIFELLVTKKNNSAHMKEAKNDGYLLIISIDNVNFQSAPLWLDFV